MRSTLFPHPDRKKITRKGHLHRYLPAGLDPSQILQLVIDVMHRAVGSSCAVKYVLNFVVRRLPMHAASGPLDEASTTTMRRRSWYGAMRRIICESSPCRWAVTWDRYALDCHHFVYQSK
jgi:hypothetical protein